MFTCRSCRKVLRAILDFFVLSPFFCLEMLLFLLVATSFSLNLSSFSVARGGSLLYTSSVLRDGGLVSWSGAKGVWKLGDFAGKKQNVFLFFQLIFYGAKAYSMDLGLCLKMLLMLFQTFRHFLGRSRMLLNGQF